MTPYVLADRYEQLVEEGRLLEVYPSSGVLLQCLSNLQECRILFLIDLGSAVPNADVSGPTGTEHQISDQIKY